MASRQGVTNRGGARPRVVESLEGRSGTLILFERETPLGKRYEITIGGHFVMAASDGPTERRLSRAVLSRIDRSEGIAVFVGGLGLGLTLMETLSDPRVEQVIVAEIEEAIIRWNRTYLRQFNEGAVLDGRVAIRCTDVLNVMGKKWRAFDAVLMDVDNGPTFLVFEGNAPLYTVRGLRRIRRSLKRGGVLGIWSNRPDDLLMENLKAAFGNAEVELIADENLREDLPPTAIYTSVRR